MPEVILSGAEGRLEARYISGADPSAPLALFLHPHPLHGGTMNNKVLYTLYKTFSRRGFACLRLNFRGVGRSQGTYDNGEGELADAATALDWLQKNNPFAQDCWLVGFSFGSWIALQLLMRRPEIADFVAVAPPVNMFDFSFLTPCPTNGLIIQGGEDTIVPPYDVTELAEKLKCQREIDIHYQYLETADHFFKSELDQLSKIIGDYLDQRNIPKIIREI